MFFRPPSACWGPIGCSFKHSSARGRAHAPRVHSGFKRPHKGKCQGNGRRHGRSQCSSRLLTRHCRARQSGPRASRGCSEVHAKPRQPSRSSRAAREHTPLVAVVVRKKCSGDGRWTGRFRVEGSVTWEDMSAGRECSIPRDRCLEQPPGPLGARRGARRAPSHLKLGRQRHAETVRRMNTCATAPEEPKCWRLPGVSWPRQRTTEASQLSAQTPRMEFRAAVDFDVSGRCPNTSPNLPFRCTLRRYAECPRNCPGRA